MGSVKEMQKLQKVFQVIKGESQIYSLHKEMRDYRLLCSRICDRTYSSSYIGEIYQQLMKTMAEYVPGKTVKERTEYQAVTKQSVIQQPVDYQQIQTTQQYQVPAQIQYAATTNQYIPTTQSQFTTTIPMTTTQYIPQQFTYSQFPVTVIYGQLSNATSTYSQLPTITTATYG
ncbi:unnamed protein product [Paramecium sonneborni]|uniref:Uncharacterized protein n=1 Tax=Paramecium sonneborni TaxID=65129 RepID=A0A8S1PVY4_9CILI|nr:unnamed protein product [Paramecium sonneborni]